MDYFYGHLQEISGDVGLKGQFMKTRCSAIAERPSCRVR